jgi:hypothetical protein
VTTHEDPPKDSQPSTVVESRTVKEPSNTQPRLTPQINPPAAALETTRTNDTAKIAAEEVAIPVNKTAPNSPTASTASPNFTTTAFPEGRTTGSRVAKSGPREAPKTIPDESEIKVECSPTASVSSYAKLASCGSGEDEIISVQKLERRRTLKKI